MLSYLSLKLPTSRSTLTLRALLLAMALLLIAGLAACGPTSATGSAPTPTPHTQQCGSVKIVAGDRVTDASATQVENCFWQAFSHCQPAILTVITMGIDTSNTRTFTIKQSSNTCALIDQSQNFAPPNHKGPLNTYTCASLVQQQGGLLFKSCQDDGDFSVPPFSQ